MRVRARRLVPLVGSRQAASRSGWRQSGGRLPIVGLEQTAAPRLTGGEAPVVGVPTTVVRPKKAT